MKVKSINNNSMTFGSVTPIIATTKGKAQLEKALANQKGRYLLDDLTDVYVKLPNTEGILNKASKEGKKILFLITGKEYDASRYMHHGWGSFTAPTRHIDRVPRKITENSNYVISLLVKRSKI